jgi:hypothetical protein
MRIFRFYRSVAGPSVAILAVIAATNGRTPIAADPPARARQPAEKSADRQLDEQLDEQLLEDLGGPSDERPAARGRTEERSLDEELLEGLEGEDVSLSSNPAEENPLVRLNQRMKQVERRIAEARGDEKTQRLQQEISDDLNKLIAALDRQCRQCKKQGSASSRPRAGQPKPGAGPAEQASDRPSENSSDELQEKRTAKVDPAKMQEMLKDVWGHLPVHLRQQMEQSANEEFLPKYELEIAEYYRSLLAGRREKK